MLRKELLLKRLSRCPAPPSAGFHELQVTGYQLMAQHKFLESSECFKDAVNLYLSRVGNIEAKPPAHEVPEAALAQVQSLHDGLKEQGWAPYAPDAPIIEDILPFRPQLGSTPRLQTGSAIPEKLRPVDADVGVGVPALQRHHHDGRKDVDMDAAYWNNATEIKTVADDYDRQLRLQREAMMR